MTPSTTNSSAQSPFANERRDNRIVAFLMGTTVVAAALLMLVH